jgi:cytoskeletal protein CcmA (bactofilin family)
MKRHDREDGKISGLIDKGCTLEGRLAFDGTVQINGDFRGDIVSDGTLIVGPEARVEGRIAVGAIIVEGSVHGEVDAKTKIELRNGSKMIADIKTPSFMVEDGSTFHGMCGMLSDAIEGASDRVVAAPIHADEEVGDSLMM